jgi:ATP-dependent DNA helicase RecQ
VEAARVFARGQDVVIEPRKLWPAGGGRKGRIVACSEGRALAFADDPGWAEALRPLFAAADAPAPQPVLDGLVAVLGRWRRSWGARPVAVVPMPSALHPLLVQSMAAHVAAVGRLALVDALRLAGPPPDADLASGARVALLLKTLALQPDAVLPAGPVLLLDARYRSGWTMTVAAALLREAGATAVLPLVLHQLP